jgi:hypothetical protein
MHAFMLQDWITIRGSVTTITQGEDGWLDLTAYQDLVFWVDCREVTGTTPAISFQTSPTKDESLFTTVIAERQLHLPMDDSYRLSIRFGGSAGRCALAAG